jgi:hypothetical protein
MRAAARRLGQIAKQLPLPIATCGPGSQASISDNVFKLAEPLLWVAASDESGDEAGQEDIFARAPANPVNRFVTVASGRLGAPSAAKADVLARLKELGAK